MSINKDKGAVIATAGGIATGGAAAIGAIASSGSVIGLSATGITSGLAAVGSVVGGGMAAGLIVTAASPLIAGATAYVLYKWRKDLPESHPLKQTLSFNTLKNRITSFNKIK